MSQSIKPFTRQSCSQSCLSTLQWRSVKLSHFLPYILWLLTHSPEHVLGPTSRWPWSWKCSTWFWLGLDWALEDNEGEAGEGEGEEGEKQQATQSINSKVQNQLSMKGISHYQFIIPLLVVSSDSRKMSGSENILMLAVGEGDGLGECHVSV